MSQSPPPHKVCLQGEALREDMLQRSEVQNSTDGLSLIAHTNISVLVPQSFFFCSIDNYDNIIGDELLLNFGAKFQR